jgi:hypothetical protein
MAEPMRHHNTRDLGKLFAAFSSLVAKLSGRPPVFFAALVYIVAWDAPPKTTVLVRSGDGLADEPTNINLRSTLEVVRFWQIRPFDRARASEPLSLRKQPVGEGYMR